MSDHARLSPSGASRWTACPGSVAAERGKPDTESDASRRGTAAHELLEMGLNDEVVVKGLKTLKMGNGYTLQADDIAAVLVAEEYVKGRTFNELHSEIRVPLEAVLGRDDCWGTADVLGVDGSILEIDDYKHGSGIVVEVKDNLQLLLYAIGGLEYAVSLGHKITQVRFGVLQPRAEHEDGFIRTVDISIAELEEWTSWFIMRAHATDDPNAPRIPGESQCRWCKNKGTCAELATYSMDKSMAVYDRSSMAVKEDSLMCDPNGLTPEQERVILDNAPLIATWLKSVQENALRRAMASPNSVLGYKVVAGRKNKSYRDEAEDVEKALRKMKKADGAKITKGDVTETKLLSPAKLTAKLKPLLTSEAYGKVFSEEDGVVSLIKVGEGSPTLAPVTDRRKALPSRVDVAFAGIAEPKKDVTKEVPETEVVHDMSFLD